MTRAPATMLVDHHGRPFTKPFINTAFIDTAFVNTGFVRTAANDTAVIGAADRGSAR